MRLDVAPPLAPEILEALVPALRAAGELDAESPAADPWRRAALDESVESEETDYTLVPRRTRGATRASSSPETQVAISATNRAHHATRSLHAPAAASPATVAATACAHVLSRPRSRAPSTTPRSTAASRRPMTRTSRTTMSAIIHAGATPVPTSITRAARTRTLSA